MVHYKGDAFSYMILNIRIFDLDIKHLFTKFPAKLQLSLANLKKEKLINSKSSFYGNNLDLHYKTRALSGNQIFGAVAGD